MLRGGRSWYINIIVTFRWMIAFLCALYWLFERQAFNGMCDYHVPWWLFYYTSVLVNSPYIGYIGFTHLFWNWIRFPIDSCKKQTKFFTSERNPIDHTRPEIGREIELISTIINQKFFAFFQLSIGDRIRFQKSGVKPITPYMVSSLAHSCSKIIIMVHDSRTYH